MYDFIEILIYISISLIIIFGLIWFYLTFDSDQYQSVRAKQITETINWLYHSVNDVCHHCNMSPIYNIVESHQITYTDKLTTTHTINGTINLVIWNDKYNRIFHRNTLIYAMLHEISHILSPSIHHDPPFDSIESILLNMATRLGYYDPNVPIESHYVTLDLI